MSLHVWSKEYVDGAGAVHLKRKGSSYEEFLSELGA
jgi:hypothetical protein